MVLNKFQKIIIGKGNRGVTLAELLVTMLIASIAISGMVLAYIDCLKHWRRASAKMVLFSEAEYVFDLMELKLAGALQFSFLTTWKIPGSQVTAKVKLKNALRDKSIEFYYQAYDNTLRYNNLFGDVGEFGIRLLPFSNYRYEAGEKHYLNIESATFTPFDPVRPLTPSTSGYSTVKVELVLTDAEDDTLTMSSVMVAKNHKSQ
jgi:prepilin-type N-terminal cleavage/methylation domain-containing protein